LKKIIFPFLVLILLSGCVAVTPTIPDGYQGDKSLMKDTENRIDDGKIELFYLSKIDGKKIDTSRSKTGKASYGHGNQLTSVLLDNEIKSTKQTFTIVGRTLFALPIRALASTVFEIAGDVTFSPEPNHIYVVKGLLKDDYSAVWIEDSSNQDEIVKKIEVNGSTELGFFEK